MDAASDIEARRYAGLGQLLTAAGVPAERTERLIADKLIDDVRETRLAISRDICTLVDGYVSGLDRRYGRQLDDAQNLLLRLSIELEVSKRRTLDERTGKSRIIIGLLLLQLVGIVAILFALTMNRAFLPHRSVAAPVTIGAMTYPSGPDK